MTNDIWYADTAYDSRKKMNPPPSDPAEVKKKDRTPHALLLLPSGVHCGEYRPLAETTAEPAPAGDADKEKLTHGQAELGSVEPSKSSIRLLFGSCALTVFMGLAGAYAAFASSSPAKHVAVLLAIGLPAFILSGRLLKKITNTKKVCFKRRTGLVSYAGKKPDERVEIPFAEFDGYYHSFQAADCKKYKLHIVHRSTSLSIKTGKDWPEADLVHMEWEFIQQYMDISLPLPDIPQFEPYRHLDPTTAEFDRQHNRPPHYWRDFDLDDLKSEKDKGFAVIKKFPWHELHTDHIPRELMDKVPKIAKRLS